MVFKKMYHLFLAFGITSAYVHLALNKPAWQSNEYSQGNNLFHTSNTADGMKSDLGAWGGQCSVSAERQRTTTWWVNLESMYSIHDIIYYRTENSVWDTSNGLTARFLGFYVYISNTTNRQYGHLCFLDTYYTSSTIPAVANRPIRCPVHGRYVIFNNERLSDVSYPNGYSKDAYNEDVGLDTMDQAVICPVLTIGVIVT